METKKLKFILGKGLISYHTPQKISVRFIPLFYFNFHFIEYRPCYHEIVSEAFAQNIYLHPEEPINFQEAWPPSFQYLYWQAALRSKCPQIALVLGLWPTSKRLTNSEVKTLGMLPALVNGYGSMPVFLYCSVVDDIVYLCVLGTWRRNLNVIFLVFIF